MPKRRKRKWQLNLRADFIIPIFALGALIYLFSIKILAIPPLGKVLNPFVGIVQNDNEDSFNDMSLKSIKLDDSVHVFFDGRGIPHIFANNEQDLYFAQGYVTAYYRLWQMDFLSYVAAGRLSEIFEGNSFLEMDRLQRRIGIPESAKASLAVIEQDPRSKTALTSYTNGVNAFIQALTYKQLPLEYKLLNYKPEPWSNVKSVLIMKQMGNLLSGYEEDFYMSKMMIELGEEKFNKIFPDFHSTISPVSPAAGVAKEIALKKPDYLNSSFLASGQKLYSPSNYNPQLGSNSWAISGKRTGSGYPILANDPHLNLSYPNNWIEMQLSCQGQSVYGVSIPGSPAIIIGFNNNIAWGMTNGADDVKDWYKLKLTRDYSHYYYEGKWIKTITRIEKIKQKDKSAFLDTVYSTIHGPIVFEKKFKSQEPALINCALRWEVQKGSNEFSTFINLNRANNYDEFKTALKTFSCPVQNFTFADKDDNIAIYHQGKISKKSPGQGKFFLDGTKGTQIPSEYIPFDSLPHLLNPKCDYVFSANQHPTFAGFKYYINGYYDDTRANRIKELLDGRGDFTISRVMKMQLDNKSHLTSKMLPALLNRINIHRLSALERNRFIALSKWGATYSLKDTMAGFHEEFFKDVINNVWDEIRKGRPQSKVPDHYILLDLIKTDPSNVFFDKITTAKRENVTDIITESFTNVCMRYEKVKSWGAVNKVSITHLANIAAFSSLKMPVEGMPQAINAVSKNWGPSFRFIVQLGDHPAAYTVLAGGQSGNPGSLFYDNQVNNWRTGKYYKVSFFRSEAEAKRKTSSIWKLH